MFLLSFLWNVKKLRKLPFLPYSRIKEEQSKRIRDIISYSYKNVPYYRRTLKSLGLRPENFKSAEDLHKLPLISKEHIQKRPHDFIPEKPLKNSLWIKTSGSTGNPTSILISKSMLVNIFAIGQRFRDVIGFKPHATLRKVRFSYPGDSSDLLDRYFSSSNWPLSYFYRRNFKFVSMLDQPNVNYELLCKFKPQYITGFGSYIDILFLYIINNDLTLPNLEVVSYTSDPIRPTIKNIIEERFCPVFDFYSASETGTIGFECKAKRGYHLNIDICAVDIMNKAGCPTSPGEEGEIVVSNLVNKGTILLNYRIGDIGVKDEESGACECGRNLPFLSNLIGRVDDVITLKNGTLLHPEIFSTLFEKKIDQIIQYKLIQENFEKFAVYCVLRDEFESRTDAIEQFLINEFEKIIGDENDIDINFVSKIPQSARKIRSVESHVKSPMKIEID